MLRFLRRQRWRQLSLLDLFTAAVPKSLSKTPPESALRADKNPEKVSLREVSNPSLERFEKLSRGVYADIRIFLSARMRKGWRLEWRRGEKTRLTLSKALQKAPDEVILAVLDWALLAQRRRPDALAKDMRRKLENQIHAWIDAHLEADPKDRMQSSRRAARYVKKLQPRGKHHDLEGIFAAINAEYFKGELKARITWSSRWGGLSTQSLRKDAEGNPYHLLTISRGYDSPSATPEIVGGVVYHECLHIVVPPEVREIPGAGKSRRTVHGREFHRLEKEYRHHAVWRRWHRESLPRILRRGP